MESLVLNSLLKTAAALGIKVIWTKELAAETPAIIALKQRCIIMNLNWHRRNELIFQLAHEIAHLLFKNIGDEVLYECSYAQRALIEANANSGAIKLLLPFYCEQKEREDANAGEFISIFAIPAHLNEEVFSQMKAYYHL
ncbi:ImmA/IrrE family metallo-endopeptidase [Liquorilactobacillus satsumensis]|uniref:IrrE N-terminal-like domain-containing protein n=1 Tax=Liquorilactobacillus satsumensis DSM 16230 = JCM 12392 TaxID=1423801 RepID=A0A0R1VAB6_9LACO|nr:ImmA/IrrE family metallo-endopeptidase [Liquorilactobacillus satsumensis]KRL99906.1 hypothetical protein FD50_GL002442 [Liquorilactobacillus satsumensis DSM 16230 = JCM 12392]MCC7665603.1 ImmA/IrrE family metallo-endopeptidase [Liquorilactobacillus satsumensis]MCP9328385.1 ImmA/IrrE family metallo-endopeptidase [Liquorilactobacillus satsumensis]MCP9357988.1 ImmA/IrrE family metallo-endopeptidase [Liquorilactobacillus satsumensis]MCP9371805.1 ImmA/IrrE family metallo-endopeptidase [Liquorila